MEGTLRHAGLSAGFRVIETLGWDGARLVRAERHLARAAACCATLSIPFDRAKAEALLGAVAGAAPLRLRLTIDRMGRVELARAPLAPSPREWRVAVAPHRLDPADPWLRVKTTNRMRYDSDRAALPEGLDEWLYANTRGELCEGSITSLFFDAGEGLRTPPLACGLLPGVLRAELLESGACREEVLKLDRIAQVRLWVGNSLRGLIPAGLRDA